jgi:hypothetical protein
MYTSVLPPRTTHIHGADAFRGCCALSASRPAPKARPCRGEPLSAQTADPLSGTRRHRKARIQHNPFHTGLAYPLLRLAPGFGERATYNVEPLASAGVLGILAVEIKTWTTSSAARTKGSKAAMAAELIIAPESKQGIAEADAWYEGWGIGFGEGFLICVEACIEAIRRT